MQPKHKNTVLKIIGITLAILFSLWLGLFLSLPAKPGYILADWMREMDSVYLPLLKESWFGFKNPFWWSPYMNQYTSTAVVLAGFGGAMGILLFISYQKNYIAGKEFGTARYADPKAVSRQLMDQTKTNLWKESIVVRHWYSFWKKSRQMVEINRMNRRLSEHLWMSMDKKRTELNNNILCVGGAGAGKSFRVLRNLIRQMTGSYVVTDSKGSLIKKEGIYLKKRGYKVMELNLLSPKGMRRSIRFNPFCYLRHDMDVIRLSTNIMANTQPKDGGTAKDPFFDSAAGVLLQALIYYVWYIFRGEKKKMNFRTVMELLKKAEFEMDPETLTKKESELDRMFSALERSEQKRMAQEQAEGKIPKPMCPAIDKYNSVMRGAADTVKSIVITLDMRLANLHIEELLDLLSEDEINIPELGMGVDFDGKTPTALFLSIPDNDTSFNFVVGMFYTVMIQELYYYADEICDGELPVPVSKLMDEFANIVLPPDYEHVISTERSRNMDSVIFLQNMAQIKALYEKVWESIVGNCDTFIYLGGNEQSTHEYVSKLMGKGTYDKRTTGQTTGMNGNASRNWDVVGRELQLPEEVRKMSNRKCLIFIRGFDPIMDDKIRTERHPLFQKIKHDNFLFDRKKEKKGGMHFVSSSCVEVIKKLEEAEEKPKIIEIDGEALKNLPSEAIDAYAESGWYQEMTEDLFAISLEQRKELEAELPFTDEEIAAMGPEKAGNILYLRSEGYSDRKIRCLLQILAPEEGILPDGKKTSGWTLPELIKLYPPSLEASRMEVLVQPFLNKVSGASSADQP